jgi:hypothetical protein
MDTLLLSIVIMLLLYKAVGALIHMYVVKETVAEMREQIDEIIRVVKLEKVVDQQNLLLAYDGESNQFLGQGFNEEEIKSVLKQRFPRKIFLMNEKPFSAMDLKEYGLEHEHSKAR